MKKILLMTLLIILVFASSAYAAPSGLIGSWVLSPEQIKGSVLAAMHGLNGAITGIVGFTDSPYGKAMVFDGASNAVVFYKGDPSGVELPSKALTIEAWAKIESRASWTGILNYSQDNGPYERGFYLGVVDGRIGGYIATARDGSGVRWDWVSWETYFELDRWYHIAFTYDGANLKLYIDGALVKESNQAYGDIVYPEQSTFALGALMDDNELEHIKGAIYEVRIYNRALSETELIAEVPGKPGDDLTYSQQAVAGNVQVVVVLKDGTALTGVLLMVEGGEILLSQTAGSTLRIKFDNILAVLPSAK